MSYVTYLVGEWGLAISAVCLLLISYILLIGYLTKGYNETKIIPWDERHYVQLWKEDEP